MSTVNFKYEQGDVLRDKVSGFTGVVMVRAEYSTGCHHYALCPQELHNGTLQEWQWLDQSRLELKATAVVQFKVDSAKPSGAFPKGPQQ
jgi:heat shock protein HspQ